MQKEINLNNKGFMLVEVIIVSVVVAVIMSSLYIAFNRVYNFYDKKETYTNLDAIYGIKTIEDYMIDEMILNGLLSSVSDVEINCESSNTVFDNVQDVYCENIFNQYKINKMYLMIKQANNKLNRPDGINESFRDYITYLENVVITNSTSNYLFIVETYEIETTNENDKKILNKYAYLEVK